MRFGQLRGVTLALGLIAATLVARKAAADGFHNTIPREVLARDLNTGGPYFAPPVPWGCYAKDGPFDSFYPKACIHGLFNHGCGAGGLGSGLFGKGCGRDGCGLGGKLCGKNGCGAGSGGKGCGLFGHKSCGDAGCGSGSGSGCGKARRIKDCGLCKNKGCGLCQSSVAGDPMYVAASAQGPAAVVAAPVATPQGGVTMLCDTCTGKGCGKCGSSGLLHHGGDACGPCGGKKCGLFGHGGFGGGHGDGFGGDSCGTCGKQGCKLFGHGSNGGDGCNNCGGKGCGLCNGLGNHMKGKLAGLLHHKKGNIKYFVGPGGPVPLTPGYVPYTVTTRSPRDFLAFPPYTPSEY